MWWISERKYDAKLQKTTRREATPSPDGGFNIIQDNYLATIPRKHLSNQGPWTHRMPSLRTYAGLLLLPCIQRMPPREVQSIIGY
ncbi:hypothetical protein CGCVW01_v007063 [Colletotrichum viniferum]|nr:hypothetical protein CGCVW01_v007063 [Colletotrichum viniferum]